MGISFISAASQAGTSITTAPTHITGDLLVRFDYRDGSTTAPTLASGWTNFIAGGTGTGNTQSARLSYKVAASGSETVGAAANATGVVCHVYRGATDFTTGSSLAVPIFGTGSSATITYPANNRIVTDGTSWMARFAGHRTATNLTTNAPSTIPNTFRTGVATEAVGFDSNGGMASDPTAGTQSVSATSGWEACTVEIIWDGVYVAPGATNTGRFFAMF